MDPLLLASLLLLAICAGAFIGAVAIGGVLLVPVMVLVLGIDIHSAIAAAMFSYVFSGLLAARNLRQQRVPLNNALWLVAGAAPGALLGSFIAPHFTATLLNGLVAILTIFAGINALQRDPLTSQLSLRRPQLVFTLVGLITGCGSAITGTGGPLVLVPLLLLMGLQPTVAIVLGQLVQLPIGLMATVGNIVNGQLDLMLGITIAVGLMLGVAIGQRVGRKLPQSQLRRLLGVGLIVVGGLMLGGFGPDGSQTHDL